jgi:hypothetical protein
VFNSIHYRDWPRSQDNNIAELFLEEGITKVYMPINTYINCFDKKLMWWCHFSIENNIELERY